MALFGGVLLAAGIALYVLEPVLSRRSAPLYRGSDEHDEAAARRRVALAALRDLEYDRATGKVDGEDYQRLRTELSREALVQLEPAATEVDSNSAAARASRALEDEIATIRRALREGLQCAVCRRLNAFGAKYCGGCGKRLRTASAPDSKGGAPDSKGGEEGRRSEAEEEPSGAEARR